MNKVTIQNVELGDRGDEARIKINSNLNNLNSSLNQLDNEALKKAQAATTYATKKEFDDEGLKKTEAAAIYATKNELEEIFDFNKGIFATENDLLGVHPYGEQGWYAFVGAENPRYKYSVDQDGQWFNTREEHNMGQIDDHSFVKKSDKPIVYSPDGPYSEVDITAEIKAKIVEKYGLGTKEPDLRTEYPWDHGTIVMRAQLKPNANYILRGLRFPHNGTNYTLNFFAGATGARSYGLVSEPGEDIFFKTNDKDIYISFYVEVRNNPPYTFSSRDFTMLETKGGNFLKDFDTDKNIMDLDKNVLFKKESTSFDVTSETSSFVKPYMQIAAGTGAVSAWVYANIVDKYKLLRGAKYRYIVSGNWGDIPGYALNLYKDNRPTTHRYLGLNAPAGSKTIEFVTPSYEDTFISFYTKIDPVSGYDFQNEDFKLYHDREEATLVDNSGTILSLSSATSSVYVEESADIESVEIPEQNVILGNLITNFTDGKVAGLHGDGGLYTIVKRLPVEAGWWYTFDLGVSTNGTSSLFVYDKVVDANTVPAINWFPFTRKQTVYISEGMKSVSFFVKITYPPNGLDFDARETVKVTRSRKGAKGFGTDYGFIDLKSIGGVIDHTNEDNITIPFPKQFGVFKTWGSSANMSASNRVTKKFELLVDSHYVSGYSEIGFQGASSINYPDRNEKDKFLKTDKKTKLNIQIGNYPARNKYHRKANYVDILNVKGIVVPRVWQRVLDSYDYGSRYMWSTPYSEGETAFSDRFDSGARMHIDGFPVVHYDNGAFMGIKTFQLTTERIDFNMSKNNLAQNVFKSKGGNAFVTAVDKRYWEEVNSDTEANDIPDDRFLVLQNFDKWLRSSTIPVFKETAAEWMDIRSFIDYYIIGYWAHLSDNFGNNMLLGTNDGKKMYAILRDLDNGCGTIQAHAMAPNIEFGKAPIEAGWVTPSGSKLWARLEGAFMPEIKARYVELRDSGVLTADTFINEFKYFEDTIPYDLLKLRADMHPQILTNRDPKTATELGGIFDGGCYNSFKRTYWWFKERAKYMDARFGG